MRPWKIASLAVLGCALLALLGFGAILVLSFDHCSKPQFLIDGSFGGSWAIAEEESADPTSLALPANLQLDVLETTFHLPDNCHAFAFPDDGTVLARVTVRCRDEPNRSADLIWDNGFYLQGTGMNWSLWLDAFASDFAWEWTRRPQEDVLFVNGARYRRAGSSEG